jgi:hypothetical protein
MLQYPLVFNPLICGLRYAQTMRFPEPEKLIVPPTPKPQATPQEVVETTIKMEAEKTNRIKANALAMLQAAQSIKALAEAGQGVANMGLLQSQLATLEKTMENLTNDAGGIGNNGGGMAGPSANAQPQGIAGTVAGPAGSGTVVGPAGQPNPAGSGNIGSNAVPPAGLAAG